MAEEQDVIKIVINKQSIFKFKELYEFMYNLLKSLNYNVVEDNFTKTDEKISFHWVCAKELNSDTRYVIDVMAKINDIKTVKLKRGELTENMDKAIAEITLKGLFITDWMNKYGSNPQAKFIKGIMDKYFKGSSFDKKKEELKKNIYLINNEINSFFEIPKFI